MYFIITSIVPNANFKSYLQCFQIRLPLPLLFLLLSTYLAKQFEDNFNIPLWATFAPWPDQANQAL